jgi:signal peptidase I
MSTTFIIIIILLIPTFVGLMKIFEKADEKPYLALIPIYNAWVWLDVIEKPKWWFIFTLIPFINVFMFFLMIVETAKTFSKNFLWQQALAAVFPFVYMPYLGFSKEEEYEKLADREEFKKSKVREWTDAIIFAVFAAIIIRGYIFEAYTIPTPSMEKSMLVGDFLFVSKFHYGPKTPNTPLSFPFVHHTLPLSKTKKSYLEWIKLDYYRFPGFTEIKNNDIVVFHYPDGDTVALNAQAQSYYALVRDYGWKTLNTPRSINRSTGQPFGEVVARPVDKRENYVKRCIAIAGDNLEIKNGQVYINGEQAKNPEKLEHLYFILTKNRLISPKYAQKMGISNGDYAFYNQSIFGVWHQRVIEDYLNKSTAKDNFNASEYSRLGLINLTDEMYNILKTNPEVAKLQKLVFAENTADPDNSILPHNPKLAKWNQDNFGPVWIPAKGKSIELNPLNIAIYERIIDVYEENDLEIKNGKYFINGEETSTYTFKMDYYWMMGDNRHNSADSRFWGFVPMDHIVGTPALIWLSLDKDKSLFKGKIRFNRMFKIPQ